MDYSIALCRSNRLTGDLLIGNFVSCPAVGRTRSEGSDLPALHWLREVGRSAYDLIDFRENGTHVWQRENRRLELFSKFDEGIQLDEEMWWSVTPEQLAVHTAERCRCDLILDGFAGAGGNTIAFAKSCKFVISCEIDPTRIKMAQANVAVYGAQVASHVDFVIADFATLTSRQLRRGAVDVVFLAPPWGGPSYNAREVFDLRRMGGMIDDFQLCCGYTFLRTLATLCVSPSEWLLALLHFCQFLSLATLARLLTPLTNQPRSVCLLPLLRAAALFTLRRDAPRARGASAQGDSSNATSPPEAHTAADTRADSLPVDCCGEEAPSCRLAAAHMHIELALCRSRREAGSLTFDQLGSCEGVAHLASGLCRVVAKARPQSDNIPADSALQAEEEPNSKRRRTSSTGWAGQALSQELADTAHERRWEAVEAAEEEVRLLEGEAQHESYEALKDLVRESRKVYAHIDDSPREWRWLPVDLLWAAAPLTHGFIRDPFKILSKSLRAAQEKGQTRCPHETETDPESALLPLVDALLYSPFPCVCGHIVSWRWRAVGVTAFFGSFGDQHGPAHAQAAVAARGVNEGISTPCSRRRSCMSELHGQQQDSDGSNRLQEGSRLRRDTKRLLKALLQDVLQFTGIHDPVTSPVVDELHQGAMQGEQYLSPPGPAGNPQPGAPQTGGNSDLEDPRSAKGGTALRSADKQPDTQGPPQQAASSIACFARQTFTPCFSPSGRLCNCFYSQASYQSRRPPVRHAGGTSRASDPEPGKPLPPMARPDFLRRVMDAYLSSRGSVRASQTNAERESTGSPPVEGDTVDDSTGCSRGDRLPEDGEAQEGEGEEAPGLWTPEEVLYWQFGCSMWCNSALHVLIAQHLAPLLQLHSCLGS
ncbi:RNA methylase, related [Eimeria brunetti]|uniref:Trimethylguanosine synthase n=1 Tax=Eimeria brunetti TaxID=51314 RepID=U6LV83_9EIME|nr:RNA methylase, related [Eimeria brunetti]